MSHPRKLIKDAIVAALIAESTAAGSRVYANRITQVFKEEYPLIFVYSRDETAEVFCVSPLTYRRRLKIGIEIACEATDFVDDDLDAIASAVEHALSQDFTLGGKCNDVIYQSTDITFDGSGEKPIGVARLIYEVTYATEGVADSENLSDFVKIENTIKVSEIADPLEQEITLQT